MSQGVDIKLKDLRYLVAVADTRHFGRAAEKCFVSQPTLSAQLKKLEDYLGVQLIERQPKNVSLTDAGEQIVARARRSAARLTATPAESASRQSWRRRSGIASIRAATSSPPQPRYSAQTLMMPPALAT